MFFLWLKISYAPCVTSTGLLEMIWGRACFDGLAFRASLLPAPL